MTTEISNIPLLSDSDIILTKIKDKDNTNIKAEIISYFNTKKAYYDFIKNYKPKQKFNTTIDRINTNYPLKFYESENKLILDIVDPIKNSSVYSKQIILEPYINLENELYNLRKLINNNYYTYDKSIINSKLNTIKEAKYLLDISYQNKAVTDEHFRSETDKLESSRTQIIDTYNIFTREYNEIITRFNLILNKIKDSYTKSLNDHNKQNIVLHTYTLMINSIIQQLLYLDTISNNPTSKLLLRKYKFLTNLLFNNNNEVEQDTLVVKKSVFEEEDNILKLNYILIVEKKINDNIFECSDLGGHKQQINKQEIFKINSIDQIIDNLHINHNINMKSIDDNEIVGSVSINNIGNKDNYISDESIKYFDLVKKKQVIKYIPKIKNVNIAVEILNSLEVEDTLDLTTQFYIGLNTLNKPYPGKGRKEKINDDILDSEKYNSLDKMKKWRNILSDNYIHFSSNKTIRPIIIDGERYASVEHYRLFCKFSKDIRIANKFKIDGDWGKIYGHFLQNKGKHSLISDNWKSLENDCIIKANFAKFKQLNYLRDNLLDTKDSVIICEDINSRDSIVYIYANPLMIVRKLMRENNNPNNYDESLVESDMAVSQSIASDNVTENISTDLATQKKVSDDIDTGLVTPEFRFFSVSANNPPGKGKKEIISDDDIDKFNELSRYSGWRRMLSNFYTNPEVDGNIEPLFELDDLKWASVEHYYQANKFKNNHPDFYRQFSLDSDSDLSKSANEAQSSGKKNGKGAKLGKIMDENFNSLKDIVMYNAMKAKFSQNIELKNMLLSTINAKLIHLEGRFKKPVRFNNLEQIRSILPYLDTSNRLGYSIIKINQQFKTQDSILYKANSYFFLTSDNIIKDIENGKNIGRLPSQWINLRDNSKYIIMHRVNNIKKPKSDQAPPEVSAYLKQLNIARKILNNKNISIPDTNDKILILASKINSLDDGYFTDFRNLKEIAEKKSYRLVEVPPDGDCMYYSIIELLKIYNIYPMNLKDDIEGGESDELGRFSKSEKELFIVAGNNSITAKISVKAAAQLREIVANKLRSNLSIDSDDIKFIKNEYMKIEVDRSGGDNENFIEDYLNGIKNRASLVTIDGEESKKSSNGRWGGELELQLISAIFNLDIIVIQPDGREITYSSKSSKEKFPEGPSFNSTTKEIHLGFLTNGKHYIGLLKDANIDKETDDSADASLQGGGIIDEKQSIGKLSAAAKIEDMPAFVPLEGYYYKSLEHNGNIYILAYLKKSDSLIEPRGFYDSITNKIMYEEDLDETEEYDKIYDEILESLGSIEVNSLSKIDYIKNLVDDSVYINNLLGDKVRIGELIQDNSSQDDIPGKKIKFD